MSSSSNSRTRNWTFVVYPESLPDNFLSMFSNLKIEAALSPLHDKDLNGDDSEKKAHYHVFLAFDSVKSYDQVKVITDEFRGTIPQMVKSSKAMIRYFCHLDNPEKIQYSISDIQTFCGFDISTFLKPTSSERAIYLNEILQFIDDTSSFEYSDVLDFSRKFKFDSWFQCLINGDDRVIYRFCNSRRYKSRQSPRCLVDFETGEIIQVNGG